jgi:RimJ/RimL family protein N-acetyltransferase
MKLSTQLFESPNLTLDYYDPEKDPQDESRFTYDLNYTWAMNVDRAAHPLTTFEVKKMREEQLKNSNENRAEYYFAIRRKEDNHFLGVVAIPMVSWSNRSAAFRVMIGEKTEREKYLAEAVHVTLRYAFEELALHSVISYTGDFQADVLQACRQAGMQECGRQREMVFRAGRYWDRVVMAMDQPEWLKLYNEE